MKKRRKFTQCPNCGYTFEDVNNYCPNCGQENHDLNVPVKHLIWEFLEGTLHYDTKFWVTIKYLLFNPGKLTKKFNLGQRASYVPPFRLYVFVSLVFFFVLALKTSHDNNIDINESNTESSVVIPGVYEETPVADSLILAREELVQNLAKISPDSLTGLTEIESPTARTAIAKLVDFGKGGEKSRQKLLKNTSFMMFLLMPFFGYLLYLFFYKQGRNYVEHLMFSIHLHTFYFLLIIVAILVNFLFPSLELSGVVILIMLLYLYLALKHVYKLSYLRTFSKLIPISLLYSLTLFVFLLGTVAISIMLS